MGNLENENSSMVDWQFFSFGGRHVHFCGLDWSMVGFLLTYVAQ